MRAARILGYGALAGFAAVALATSVFLFRVDQKRAWVEDAMRKVERDAALHREFAKVAEELLPKIKTGTVTPEDLARLNAIKAKIDESQRAMPK